MIGLFYNDISNKINTVLKWQLEFRPRFFIVYDSRNSQHFTKILRLKTLVSQRALQYNLQWILILIFLLWKVWLKKRIGNLLQYNFVVLFLSSVCNLFHEKFSWVVVIFAIIPELLHFKCLYRLVKKGAITDNRVISP